MKINTILVPTDFSAPAEHALSTAMELAKAVDAKIVLLHAYHVDVPVFSTMAGGYSLPQSFYDDVLQHATTQLDQIVKKIAADGIDATGIALCEPAAIAILGQAEELPADLIVMGTRGHTGLKHVVLGSVAERVVRTAACPVLTVKDAVEGG